MSKRVLITGGASGPGLALTERYGAAGHRVMVADLHEPAELPPGDVSFLRVDVRVPSTAAGLNAQDRQEATT